MDSTAGKRGVSGGFQPLLTTANRLAGPALLFGLMVLAFWRILLTDQYSWLNGYDLTTQVMPWLQFQAGEWQAGRIPLWSPYEWGGQNLIGQGQPGVVNPLNWILFLAPLRRGWLRQGVLHWWFFLLHFIGALNLYWLARQLGASRIPAVFGGLCFGLLGFLGGNDWPQMISGVIWAPLVLLFLFRSSSAASPWRDAGWAGFFLGLSWLSGHHQLPIFVSLAAAGTAIALRLPAAILSFAIGGLLAAPQLLTGLLYGRGAVRWVGMESPVGWNQKVAYYVHEQYATTPVSLLSIVLPGAESHTSLFLGATALGLAIWAWIHHRERMEVRCLLGIGVFAVLYSMGRWGGIEPLLYSLLPMVEKARSPSMAAALFTLSFAVLAALGLELLRSTQRPAWLEKWHWYFGGGLFALFTVAKLFPANATQLEQRWLVVGFVSLLLATAYRSTRKWIVPIAVCAVMIEASNSTYYNQGNRFDKNGEKMLDPMSKHMDVRDFLATLPAPVRVTVDDKAIVYNFGDWYGVEVMGGYLASLSRTQYDTDFFSPRGRALAGIGYHVGPAPRVDGSTLLYSGESGVNVYQYPTEAFPRVWVTSGNMAYGERAQFDQWMNTDSIDLRQMTLTRQPVGGLGTCGAGEAALLRHDSTRVLIQARARCRSILVLADADEAGWSVKVDGAAAEKLTVYQAFRGVAIPEGNHTVEWSYSPPGLRIGLAGSLAGLILLAVSQRFRATRR